MQNSIQYCNANELASHKLFFEELRAKYPNVSIVDINCLGYCVLCARYPYVILNKQRLTAETMNELQHLIEQKLKILTNL